MGAHDWRDAMLEALRTAVRRRMVSDVQVGVLLSGGLDSSLIVALLAQAGQRDLMTFSVGFESEGGEEGDEFRYSDLVAREFGTDHRRLMVPSDRVSTALDGAVAAMSEPMTSHDVVAFYLLSEQVSKEVKVVQSGQGADEVLMRLPLVPAARRRRPRGRGRAVRRHVLRPAARRSHPDPGTRHAARRRRLGPFRPGPHGGPRSRDGPGRGPASGHARDARRRPGQAGRQHDHGLGAGGPSAVPRPRTGRAGRGLPAGTQAGRRRQGRAEGGRLYSCCPGTSSTGPRATSRSRRSGTWRAPS